MIADSQTNFVYLADTLQEKFPNFYIELEKLLKEKGNEPKLLPNTNDIWARDYMPIQINDSKYIEYRYDPDYLQGIYKGYRNLKTYPDMVCDKLKLKTVKSDIIMDGGNFVKSSDCVIMTDKVIKENFFRYTKIDLLKKLCETFEVEKIVLIPWDKLDDYGHSDGMVRFIDNSTVLINYLYKDDKTLINRIKQAGLKTEFIDFKVKKKDKRNWAYLNFLQTKDLILLPKLGIEEDAQAFEQIESFYPDYKGKIAQIDMAEIIKLGGALNCITWTTKEV